METKGNILAIEWKIEDIVDAMKEVGLEPTEENLLCFCKSENLRIIEERSIVAGWDIIYSILENQKECFRNRKNY